MNYIGLLYNDPKNCDTNTFEAHKALILAYQKKINEKRLEQFEKPKKDDLEDEEMNSCLLRCFVKTQKKDKNQELTIEELRELILKSAEQNYKKFSGSCLIII